ncbi:ABC transporter substrate-binding protein [Mycolicibacterium gilvum]|uniref:ABC-type Fe3+-hydroxamate transporter periplasmic protein n=1 Tax=Mycolicibacterium gilvum TaxID=1804 RepID=A0A378SE33_9MYCO|nr:ABC transporter substrate-binding protein [Mycolicibacterium gilvum]MCV7056390.1 ABC transporter substrate-binding protein [Mycolicibacterium gilvum]STZ41092.1 ABC-type Fe3+-hydroxamate transporter periplasmic protein [Mycolicibacterium gilvum]
MSRVWSRRSFLGLAAGAAATLTACGSEKPGTVAGDGSVTVTHAFGETRIPGPPTRVVSAGLTDADDLLTLGVVPIAVTDWFGGEPFGVWPWARPQLGAAQPAVLSLADGVQVEQIAALSPDLIIATDAGLDQDTYTRLSEIAPTVAQSGRAAFFEPWRDQAGAIGQAVFRHDDMQKLIADVDARFSAVKDAHPQFTGKKALLLAGTLTGDGVQVSGPPWRREFLTAMGLTVLDTDDEIPRDRLTTVLDEADVLIWTTENDQEQAALLADPVVAGLRATAANRHVFTGKELAGAIAYASTLSYPVLAERLPPMLDDALT